MQAHLHMYPLARSHGAWWATHTCGQRLTAPQHPVPHRGAGAMVEKDPEVDINKDKGGKERKQKKTKKKGIKRQPRRRVWIRA